LDAVDVLACPNCGGLVSADPDETVIAPIVEAVGADGAAPFSAAG
jgi:hypothetical protein